MKNLIIFLLLTSLLAACTQPPAVKKSFPLSEASPESVGISSERLSRIDSLLQQAVAADKIPGVVALVARNGKIVFYKAAGMADNQSGRKLKRDDIFRIASQTKAVTATAVMILWEEGKFSLDDHISQYIPEFKNPGVLNTFNPKDSSYTTIPAVGEITIRQLLDHTSGLGYGVIGGDDRLRKIYQKAGIVDAFCSENITIGENIRKPCQTPVTFQPRRKI